MTASAPASPLYLCNPDIVLREEDEDGGLLYNPDSNQVKVVNATGLFIWKQFGVPNHTEVVAAALLAAYEDAPKEEVDSDVQEFLEGMLANGFIGIVESKA
jgi:hypothetical protein